MTSRSTVLYPGEIYHVYNRGVDRRKIFQGERDYRRFQLLLYTANGEKSIKLGNYSNWQSGSMYTLDRGEPLVDIGVYCLMPNHFHLLLMEREEGGITRFMQKLSTGYSMYFNKKHSRTGTLFESAFRAEHASIDPYAKYLFSYIHLNPVSLIQSNWREEGLADIEAAQSFLGEYPYSSYLEYRGRERSESSILNRGPFPDYFEGGSAVAFAQEIEDWLTLSKEEAA